MKMTSGKNQLKNGTVAGLHGEGQKEKHGLKKLGDKAAASIGGKTEGLAKAKLSPAQQEALNKKLIDAIMQKESGDDSKKLAQIKKLLDAGADPNAFVIQLYYDTCRCGRTFISCVHAYQPLALAIEQGNKKIQALLEEAKKTG